MLDRRFGGFFLPKEIVDQPKLYLLIMSGIVVHRCEHMYQFNSFGYSAWSERFDICDHGDWYYEYDVVLSLDNGQLTYEFNKSPLMSVFTCWVDGLKVGVDEFLIWMEDLQNV